MNGKEIFDLLKNLSRDYIFLLGQSAIIKKEDNFAWEKPLDQVNLVQMGSYPTEMLVDVLSCYDLEEITEEGFYNFEATLKSVYTPYEDFEGFEVDHIEFTKIYSIEEHYDMTKELENNKWDNNEITF